MVFSWEVKFISPLKSLSVLNGWRFLVALNRRIGLAINLRQLKKKCSASSISLPQLHYGSRLKWLLYKSLFRLLQLFLILVCKTDQYLSPHKMYCGTWFPSVRTILRLVLKHDKLLDLRVFSSSEFHRLTEEGIQTFVIFLFWWMGLLNCYYYLEDSWWHL